MAPLDAMTPLDVGSNGWAIGSDRTESGTGGILLANPHFPWEGELRFEEVAAHRAGRDRRLRRPAGRCARHRIGFTEGVAWTHTVSAGKRFTGYQLTLDPGVAHLVLVDGVSTPMTSTEASVDILRADGTVASRDPHAVAQHVRADARHPGVGWTTNTARELPRCEHRQRRVHRAVLRTPQVQSIDDLIELNRTYQGVPLFNTVATGAGRSRLVRRHVRDPEAQPRSEDAYLAKRFVDPVTQIAYDSGFVLLDGSTTANDWQVV